MCYFVLLYRYWGIVTVPVSIPCGSRPGVAGSSHCRPPPAVGEFFCRAPTLFVCYRDKPSKIMNGLWETKNCPVYCSARNVFLRGPLTLNLLFSQSFFLPRSPNPHSLTCLRRRLNRCNSTGALLVLCQTFPRISWRLVSCRMFGRLFPAGISERPSPRCLPMLTVARFAPARCV